MSRCRMYFFRKDQELSGHPLNGRCWEGCGPTLGWVRLGGTLFPVKDYFETWQGGNRTGKLAFYGRREAPKSRQGTSKRQTRETVMYADLDLPDGRKGRIELADDNYPRVVAIVSGSFTLAEAQQAVDAIVADAEAQGDIYG